MQIDIKDSCRKDKGKHNNSYFTVKTALTQT